MGGSGAKPPERQRKFKIFIEKSDYIAYFSPKVPSKNQKEIRE